jgi:chemosensory pili system protein ChpC
VSAETEELYSLLVPLSEDRLILPRACVAEVVRYTQPVQQPGSQNWMLGTIGWNGRQLPVVAFEGTIGKDIPAPTGRTRVVVFYSSTGKIKTGYFVCRVKMINEYPLVPDLEALEGMIIEESVQA